ncbi:hypothetical protein SO802_009086, partial [Lithocarpus litseifolius]
DIFNDLKRHKDEDLFKGQAVKNQKALWDKALQLRLLVQKAFSSANRLPQEPVRSSFCNSDEGVNTAYSDLITSSKNTLNSLLELQEALLEKNPSVAESSDGNSERSSKHSEASKNLNVEGDEDWSRVSQLHLRIASFRDKSIDKWQRKTEVATGAAAIKGKLHAFNQVRPYDWADYNAQKNAVCLAKYASKSFVESDSETPGFVSDILKLLGLNQIYESKSLHKQSRDVLRHMCRELPKFSAFRLENGLLFKAIYIAVKRGMVEFVSDILHTFPDFSTLCREKGTKRNMIMIAVLHRQKEVLNFLYSFNEKNSTTSNNLLLAAKDNKKNNILHIAAMFESSTTSTSIPGAAFLTQSERQWFKKNEDYGFCG